MDHHSYRLLDTKQIISLQDFFFVLDTMDRVVGLCPTHKNFTEKTIMVPSFLAGFKHIYDNCDVYEGENVCVLPYLFSDGAENMYESCSAARIHPDPHVDHGTWPVFLNPLIQRSLTKIVLHELPDLVNQPPQRWTKTN